MGTVIFIALAVMLGSIIIYLYLRRKPRCPQCKGENIIPTGKKLYGQEPPIALWSSPESYAELEHKCTDCGHVFGLKKRSVISKK